MTKSEIKSLNGTMADKNQEMLVCFFQIGEKVIHVNHGIGDIVKIEDKMVRDRKVNCYVVRTPDLTVWVPIEDGDRHSLRAPTSKREFKKLFSILRGPNEPLPEDALEEWTTHFHLSRCA